MTIIRISDDVVFSDATGMYYVRTPADQWLARLVAYAEQDRAYDPLLNRLYDRAMRQRVPDFRLYRLARRGTFRRNPVPLPWGHLFFEGGMD